MIFLTEGTNIANVVQNFQEKFVIFAAVKEMDSIIIPIATELRRFDVFFDHTLKAGTTPMRRIMDYVTATRGKRLRPAMVLLCAKLFDEVNERTLRAATAIEVIHSASLIHDDVVDQSDERRGRASVKACFGDHSAVLFGDYLLAQAVSLLTHPDDHALLKEVTRTAVAMTEGELLQSQSLRLSQGNSCPEYMEVITRKTAQLFRASCVMGALSVNAPAEALQAVADYGLDLGIVFQLRDDILDADSPETLSLAQSLLPSQLEKTLTALESLTRVSTNTAILSALADLTYFCAQREA